MEMKKVMAPYDDTVVSSAQLSQQNKYSPIEGLAKMAQQSKGCIRASYDYAVQGGAVGNIRLKDELGNDLELPDDAVITRSYIDVKTAPTSGGAATIGVSTGQGAGDVKAAAAIADYTGLVEGLQDGTMAAAIKLTAKRQPVIAVAVAALTAGKFDVFLEFVQGH
jgi:hypothetical protein